MRGVLKRFGIVLACLVLLCGSALAYNTLEKGSSGSEVLRMQQALCAIGYTVGTDGSFGEETRNVVKAFQRDHGLKVDGKAGDETLTLLYGLLDQLNLAAQTVGTVTQSSQTTATVYCANGGKLNLRAGAGTGYKTLTQIPNGAAVTLLTRGDKWCNVVYNGQEGYVMTSFLRFSESGTPSQPSGDTVLATVYCADGGKLNLRKTADSNAKVLTRIPNGTVLTVTPVNAKWCATAYNGESGYVMRSFLVFGSTPATNPPAVTPTPTPTPTPGGSTPAGSYNALVYCADGGKLNLRKTASASAKVLAQIPTGTPLNVTRVDNTWCAATYAGQTGFVMSKFLIFTGGSAATPTPTPTPTPGSPTGSGAVVYCENGGKLNLREGADTGYRVLLQIPNGSAVSVVVRGVTWSQVSYNGVTGYVQSKFLIFGASAATPTPAPGQNPTPTPVPGGELSLRYGEFRYGIVQTVNGSLNVRKGPDTGYGKVSEVRDGTLMVITAVEGEWCAVYYGDIEGYVMKQYLVIQPASGSTEELSQYDTSIFTRVLRSGYTGADVTMLQTRLVELKYLAAVTGTYDSATVAAVKTFQTQNGLTSDGLAGNNTIALLFSQGAFAYNANTGSYSTYVMDYNDNTSSEKTAAVLNAQRALRELNYNVPLTGGFEARTHDAIVAFQLRNGITASGILDAATQTRLFSGSAHDAAWPARFYLADDAGTGLACPTSVELLHWANDVKGALSGYSYVTAYDPVSGLSWRLSIMSRGRHLDVQPTTLEDTLIQKKAFVTTSWDIHPVYILLPDGRWSLATMHNYPHGSNTIMNNGFGGQNCVHFLRDMSEAQANDPKYGVRNQEALREAWYDLTGVHVN